MGLKTFAGIDIGSNGTRLLIVNILKEKNKPIVYLKNTLSRVPIRLGGDVFEKGKICKSSREKLCNIVKAYKYIMQSQGVVHYRACATSAMREAKNGKDVAKYIYEQTGIRIEIISGEEEAEIVSNVDIRTYIKENKNYMGIDVGGGSTEITIYEKGKKTASCSFPIGAVRLLNNNTFDSVFGDMGEWIKNNTDKIDNIIALGSGGNINKVFKESGKKKGTPLSIDFLEEYLQELQKYDTEQRMRIFGFSLYRADVIVKALPIYITAMKMAKSKSILIPKIGLVDGIVRCNIGHSYKIEE